jgi:hypothetical protein
MSRLIEEGDKIKAFFGGENHWYDEITGIVHSMPSATGDLLYMETDKGEIFGINTASTSFEGLKVIGKKEQS